MHTKVRTYESDDATVTWDQHRCIHFAACVHGLPTVFDPDRKPWVQPEHAEAGPLLNTVTACPTGALHLRLPDGTDPETVPDRNRVTVAADGPLYVRGDVTVLTPDGEVLLKDTRVALCRCGLSSNKPLCDNSHRDAFADAGTLPDASGETAEAGGALEVHVLPNGPVRVVGAADGEGARTAQRGRQRRSRSAGAGPRSASPTVTGTHRQIGFVAP